MKSKAIGPLLFVLTLALALAVSARPDGKDKDRDRNGKDKDDHEQECRDSDHHDHELNTPVGLVGVISIPGTPLVSSDIAWVDPGTEELYVADRSNFGVDVIDVETNTWLGRIGGFVGPNTPPPHTPALTPPPNGQGPNGVVVTPSRLLFAGDGNSNLQVADVDPSHLSTYLKIIQTISTADPECDSGSVHKCNRADEVGWDPVDRIVMIANDAPAPVGLNPAYPYASFYQEVNPTTYTTVGRVFFPGAGGLEQPVWDPELRRFLITVPGSATQGPGVAVIDPHHLVTPLTPQYLFNCTALGGTGTSANGAILGPFQHLLVSMCGEPIILNALNGHVINVITQVGGGDEVAFNHGDGRFYVTSADKRPGPTNGATVLGVIDAETSTWLQNFPDPGGKAPEGFGENNHIFTDIQISGSVASAPYTGNTALDMSTCTLFGLRGTGCIAVFAHSEEISQK